MPVNESAIVVDHVSVCYGGHMALDAVSFAVPEGSYVGILGPNGGGKTTILKVILGLEKPHKGTVSLFGLSPEEARKTGAIGYVPQRLSQMEFSFPATVEEIVRSGRAAVVGIGKRLKYKDGVAVDHALSLVGIEHFKNRLISELSGGERQKVFIARALAAEPRLLMLDEPTTGVDVTSREQFYSLLKKLNKELGLTILFVSHDVEATTQKVSFILALNQKLICHCSSHDFVSPEMLKRLYGSDTELLHPHHHH